MPIYSPYLVYGTILNSEGNISPNASIEVVTSVSRKYYSSNSSGTYLFDLAEAGYVDGETLQMNIKDKFNNQFKNHTFVVSDSFHQEDITLDLRVDAVNAQDYAPKAILHSVGKKPITPDNPLPIMDKTDALKGYILAGGDDANRTYGYVNVDGSWYIQKYNSSDLTYRYVRGVNDFIVNWNGRDGFNYKLPNEVF